MPFNIYEASVPMYVRMLGNLRTQLEKAEAHATEKKFDVNILMQERLAPDMLAFARQVQIACDTAKNFVARVSGVEAPKYEDTEKTIAELKTRIDNTLTYLKSVPVDRFAGAEDKQVELPRRDKTLKLTGQAYFLGHGMPNFYFHYTTAYAILRHNGVDLGKADFLRGLEG